MVEPVVSSEWLAAHRKTVLLADVRWYLDGRSGREAHERGHIPGAVFVDLDTWLSGPSGDAEGRHPLPSPEQFASGMAACGIEDTSTVIAYDDAGGVIAARLVWMLRVTDHAAALLDGGLEAYTGPLETGPVYRAPTTFTPRSWPAELIADADTAIAAPALIDARDRDRYRGEHEPVDPRSGHIPGARNLPCRENLDSCGRLLPPEVLRRRFREVGVVSGEEVVSYCGSGVTACHNLLALEYAGLGKGRLFPGSWSQYSRDLSRPVATGDMS